MRCTWRSCSSRARSASSCCREFARAREAGALGREVGSWSLALAVPLVPAVAVAIAAPHWVAGLLTGGSEARSSAAELLPWLIPAAAAQVYAGIAASALAALDDYGTAAFGYAAGGDRRARRDRRSLIGHGVQAFGWGLALNGAVALAIPLVVADLARGLGRPGGKVGRRLRMLVEGVSLPFALQGLYVIGYRFASGLGSGRPTTFSYAYLIASLLVAVTATSIALVSSVPLSRGRAHACPDGAARRRRLVGLVRDRRRRCGRVRARGRSRSRSSRSARATAAAPAPSSAGSSPTSRRG